MTGPHPDDFREDATRPVSVAELLAKNGTIGSPPVTGRRRRRRGNSDEVTVAELTGEIPVIGDEVPDEDVERAPARAQRPSGGDRPAMPGWERVDEGRPPAAGRAMDLVETVNWSEPEPRWPESESPPLPRRSAGPERSHYPRPVRRDDRPTNGHGEPPPRPAAGSGAERMSPDPVDNYADIEVDVMDTEVRDVDLATEDSAYVRSYLRNPRKVFGRRRGGPDAPEPAEDQPALGMADLRDGGVDRLLGLNGPDDLDRDDFDEDDFDEDDLDAEADLDEDDEEDDRGGVLGAGLIVLQSVLAVAFGAGLFIAFDQLWSWNNIVALVLTVLVTLGLVAAVQAVRKTVDVGSTLIAVAVGLLVTLGPLALHAN